MAKSKLSNVCLCSIVRDEEINPAGGIVDFINCTVPFVGNAVIVDTGSTDKTRELLEDAKKRYSHLQVCDYEFTGYAQARNFSLALASGLGKYALVLDADERLFSQDFAKLEDALQDKKMLGIKFKITDIDTEGISPPTIFGLHNPRCFSLRERFTYRNSAGKDTYCEHLFRSHPFTNSLLRADSLQKVIDSEISIKHFRAKPKSQNMKMDWYESFKDPKTQSQSQDPNFKLWKELNPLRREYPWAGQ